MATTSGTLRFGLVGTGYWAQIVHAPALASTPGIEFAGLWGRNLEAATSLAARHAVTAYSNVEDMLADVDGIAFAVPPHVQAAIAERAARAGKHLLLEKPIATTQADADRLLQAVRGASVASVVFFTYRFDRAVRDWLADVAGSRGWSGGAAMWLGTALADASPFNTPWRRDKGALWDLSPHVIALFWASLGPVSSVSAQAGPADVTHLVLRHQGGATSTATVTMSAKEPADGFELFVWGARGRSDAPVRSVDAVAALRVALTELAACTRTGQPHPCDVAFGYDVGVILAAAERERYASQPEGSAQMG